MARAKDLSGQKFGKLTVIKRVGNNRTNNHLITYNGETKTISQWAEERNINHDTLYSRINRANWDIGRALGYEC